VQKFHPALLKTMLKLPFTRRGGPVSLAQSDESVSLLDTPLHGTGAQRDA
jgi:hypothetical protein